MITIGADPEVFAYNKETGKPVSVHELLPGTKEKPFSVPRGAIQVDGTAAEFNIVPAKNRKEFVKNIKHVYGILDKILKKNDPSLELRPIPTAVFDEEYFASIPYYALQLGCEPDYDAYTLKENVKPVTNRPIRTGAGHIHIGFNDKPEVNVHHSNYLLKCASLVKELDFAFLPVQTYWDTDEERRMLYGAPGAFRPKTYGLEYRVLSNAWLKETWSIMYVHDLTKAVATLWSKGESPRSSFSKIKKKPNSLKEFSEFMSRLKLPTLESYTLKPIER